MDKITDPLEKQLMQWLTLIRMEDKKAFYSSFLNVTSTNIGLSPQNFLTFGLNHCVTLA